MDFSKVLLTATEVISDLEIYFWVAIPEREKPKGFIAVHTEKITEKIITDMCNNFGAKDIPIVAVCWKNIGESSKTIVFS